MPNTDIATTPASDYLKQGSLVMLLSVVLGFAADYLFNLTLSKALPPHEYGDYKVAFAFAALTGVLVLLGGDRVAPRVLAAPLARGDNRSVWEFLRFYLWIAAGLSLLVIFCTCIASYLHLDSTDIRDHHPLLLMSFAIPLIAVGALLSRILQAAKLLMSSNLPWRIALPLLKVALLLMLMTALTRVELWQVIASGAASVGLIIAWQWYEIRRKGLLTVARCPEAFPGPQILKLSVPMMLAMLITLGLNQLDLFMLEALGDEHEVGYFAAAATTAHMLPVAQVTIAGLFLPLIGPALEQGRQSAKALFWQGQRLIVLTVLALSLFLAMAGGGLLSLFGSGFLQAEQALHYLTLAYGLWALVAFASTWLQYAGKGSLVVLVGCVTLVIDAGCNLWLIPLYGIDGAALATLIAMALAAIMIAAGYYRHSAQSR
ncbi:oligosaccharide flippase family protein [Shewanella sp. AS16]|uniref:oligosaccharide flippase family protein n=1 Tax=Shewanella sp. AS16 TaxID=2907625 RepID=UPI001F2E60C0|nr:oligosaccharide flippase family protein [Shewanella sp. AS16]MCE9687571.1 oligosaccharide flippase family protein [Shewanella sp. AS16]